MKFEELLDILDIEGPEEFKFFENFSDLIECEEEVEYDALYSLIKSIIGTPCCPKAGPTGGAGVASPA